MTKIRFNSETALNVPNLNDLNNVVISPTKPTTGEEVWIQKGKNLFDKNTVTNDYRIGSDGQPFSDASGVFISDFIEVETGKTYATNWNVNTIEAVAFYNSDKNFLIRYAEGNSFDVTSAKYMRISGYQTNVDIMSVEEGSITPKKIYAKNDNGVYEEFYDETNREIYSLGEQRIGTYLGKPLYRKVITGNIADNTTLVSNVDVLLNAKGSGDINMIYRTIPYYELFSNLTYALLVNKNFSNEIKATVFKAGEPYTAPNCNIVLEYTKTTD